MSVGKLQGILNQLCADYHKSHLLSNALKLYKAHFVHFQQVKAISLHQKVSSAFTSLFSCGCFQEDSSLLSLTLSTFSMCSTFVFCQCFPHYNDRELLWAKAYLCVHRRAYAVNKPNMQIVLFSTSVRNKVQLPKNPIIADNYYPEGFLVSVLTDHCSQQDKL